MYIRIERLLWVMFEGIPMSRRSSNVSESGLVEKHSDDQWQEDNTNSVGVQRAKFEISGNEICNINVLDPFLTGYVNDYNYKFFTS